MYMSMYDYCCAVSKTSVQLPEHAYNYKLALFRIHNSNQKRAKPQDCGYTKVYDQISVSCVLAQYAYMYVHVYTHKCRAMPPA